MKGFPLSRRRFLATLAAAVGTFALSGLRGPLAYAARVAGAGKAGERKSRYGMGIDVDKCIGCGMCADACKSENGVSRKPFFFRTWIERYILRRDGEVEIESPNGGIDGFRRPSGPDTIRKTFFVPKLCNHCEESPCVQVCPVGASFDSPDGVVLVDQKRCIACHYCIQACPYGCRYYNHEKHAADKCTLCYHRIKRGMKPACAEACPTGARLFGDLADPRDPLNAFLDSHKIQVLKPHMATRPKVFYSGLEKEVR